MCIRDRVFPTQEKERQGGRAWGRFHCVGARKSVGLVRKDSGDSAQCELEDGWGQAPRVASASAP
eukprot:6350339-Lingulodinium_polyedra.AAC.1